MNSNGNKYPPASIVELKSYKTKISKTTVLKMVFKIATMSGRRKNNVIR